MLGMSAIAVRTRLAELAEERAAAALCGLDRDPVYMADLVSEIAECRAAYIGYAVTEIATFRGQLHGCNAG
jgi:hypothetical protein